MNAENTTGGWVGFTFHHVCADCDVEGLSTTPALFQSFAEWLAARPTTHNTSVRTVNQVIGGAVKPLVPTTLPPAPGPGVNGVVNPSLEQVGTNGVPDCWITAGFGANVPTFSTVSPGRTGSVAERLVMSNYVDGDAKLIFTMDFGTCAPTVTPGHRYSLRAWYSSSTVTQFAVYLRNSIGAWEYWTSSPYFAAASTYAQAVWDSGPIPAGYTGISFGLNLFGNGTLVTDDYALYDLAGAPPAPPTGITVSRLAGADRYGTAVAIAKQYNPGVDRVYVATGSVFADALGAAPAAARFDSPMLLTASSSLPTSVRNEIVRLAPGRIIVVGGIGAVGHPFSRSSRRSRRRRASPAPIATRPRARSRRRRSPAVPRRRSSRPVRTSLTRSRQHRRRAVSRVRPSSCPARRGRSTRPRSRCSAISAPRPSRSRAAPPW